MGLSLVATSSPVEQTSFVPRTLDFCRSETSLFEMISKAH